MTKNIAKVVIFSRILDEKVSFTARLVNGKTYWVKIAFVLFQIKPFNLMMAQGIECG